MTPPVCIVSFLIDGLGGDSAERAITEALASTAPEMEPSIGRHFHALRVTMSVPIDEDVRIPEGTWWSVMYRATAPIDVAFDALRGAMETTGLEPHHVLHIAAELHGVPSAQLAPVIELHRAS